jgi:uncharacterized protein YdhG (YjbR/CyaY superfamily)
MKFASVDEYLADQPEPKRSTLQAVRKTLLGIEPALEEAIAWNAPMFKLNGKNVIGLCAFKNHLTLSPQSEAVMSEHTGLLAGYVCSKNSFQFPVDQPVSKEILETLVRSRISEIS